MNDEDIGRSIAAMQLAHWLLLRLVNSGAIPRNEALSWLRSNAVELNIKGNAAHIAASKIFDALFRELQLHT